MDQNKIWGATGSILGPVLFLVYNFDLSKATEHTAIPILFIADTSILITSPDIVLKSS
jgi:hypothetical protein